MSVEQWDGTATAAPVVSARSGRLAELLEWGEAATAVHRVAQSLAKTTFVPAHYRNKPNEATAAILAGMELGLSPIASLNAFFDVNGTSAPLAMTLRAVVLAAGHEIWEGPHDATRAVMYGRRHNSDKVITAEWDIARAQRAGLAGKKNWRENPESMLVARATAQVCRIVAADAILGIPYSAEELGDGVADESRTRARRRNVTQPSAVANTRPPAQPTPQLSGPPLPGESDEVEPAPWQNYQLRVKDGELAEPHPPADGAGDKMTHEQKKKLFAELSEHGITERNDRLGWANQLLAREITSFTALTSAEASYLIDQLERAGDTDTAEEQQPDDPTQ